MSTKYAWVISDLARKSLEDCELFLDLGMEQLKEVAALVDEYIIEPDEVLLKENEAARHLYVIVEGRGVAQISMHRGWLSLGLVGPSEPAGWSSLVGDQAYPATVRALTPMRIARIDAEGLVLLMTLHPDVGFSINRRLSAVFFRQYRAALESFRNSG